MTRRALLLLLVAGAGCRAELEIPPGAVIACAINADCPADHACIEGRCLSAALQCVVDVDGALGAAADGTACTESPDGVCVKGLCFTRGCGDGLVDADGEECDFGADNDDALPDRCRTDCTLPRCGDGVVDRGESCDDDGAECDQCAQLCSIGKADCDGAPGCECAPQRIFDTEGPFIEALAVDDDAIFALGATPATDQQIALLRIARDGSASTVLHAPIDPADVLVLGAHHAYFNDAGNVVRVPRAGGDEEIVAPEFRFCLDGGFVYGFDDTTGIARVDEETLAREVLFDGAITGLRTGVAVRGHVYVALDTGDVSHLAGGAFTVVATRQIDEGVGVELATDGRDLWWLDDHAQLWRMPLADGAPAGPAAVVTAGPDMQRGARTYHLIVDDIGAVYAAEIQTDFGDGKGGIMDVVGGRAARMRARHVHQENAVAADARSLCWSDDFSVIYCIPR